MHVICKWLTLLGEVHIFSSKVTTGSAIKPEPVPKFWPLIVNEYPPAVDPEAGEIEEIEGGE
jgi:hypothetical protein